MVLSIVLVVSYILSLIISIKLILENRNPSKTLAWILIFMIFPIIGLLFYIVLGRNIRKIKINKMNKLAYKTKKDNILFDANEINKLVNNQIEIIKQSDFADDENIDSRAISIISLLLNGGSFPFIKNNKIDLYKDGNEKFDNLIEDIRSAKSYIHLEYFIIKDSEIGKKIKTELIKKAKQGVKIRIIYDNVGCWRFWINNKFIKDMKSYNIEVVPYLKGKVVIPLGGQINYRNHKKIVVIDGLIGYMGGVNIGDEYIGKNKKFGYWRDTHIKIQGTAVHMLQMMFLSDWYYNTKEVLPNSEMFPKVSIKGNSIMQIVSSGPDCNLELIHLSYFYAICQSKQSIYIQTPYFIPDETLLESLKCAILNGVEVIILFPKIADHKIVNIASYSYFEELLQYGAKVYLYKKGFLHSKVMIIDNFIASTGSANMDLRSFKLNFEVNAFIYDKEFIDKMKKQFLLDLEDSEQLNETEFYKRGNLVKMKESISRLFSPIL